MTYKPIELRPLRPLRAENQEENVGVNGLNRRHRRRVPLWVWVAVALLVFVLFGCIATIAYVNLSADTKQEEEMSFIKGSWAIVLGGRGDTFNRHIEVVDLSEGCGKAPPSLPPLPESIASAGEILKASFQPEQGILVCGSLQGSCFLLSEGSSQWNPTLPQDRSQWNLIGSKSESSVGERDNTKRRRGATILRTEFGTYMLGGSRADGELAESVLKWDPGEKRWEQEKGSLAEGRISPTVTALPCSFQVSLAPPKFHRLLDMKPFT